LNNCVLFGNSQFLYKRDVLDNNTFLYLSIANSFYGYGGVVFSNDVGDNITYASYMDERGDVEVLSFENNIYKEKVKLYPNNLLKNKYYLEKEYLYNFLSKFLKLKKKYNSQ
jgi:hypothetical protein